MIFYFLIIIVFIAELIITFAIILNLLKLDKKFIEYNDFLDEAKPAIKELMITVRKLSEQFTEIAPIIVKQIKSFFIDMITEQIKSALGTFTFFIVKKEIEKRV